MAWNEKVINEYLETHLSKYVGKYRFHSGYQSDDKVYKAHYYMFDENFRQIPYIYWYQFYYHDNYLPLHLLHKYLNQFLLHL